MRNIHVKFGPVAKEMSFKKVLCPTDDGRMTDKDQSQ